VTAPSPYARLFDLADRVAIVTGGGGVLGREIGRGLAAFGARVIFADLDRERAADAARGVPGARAETVDVTDPESAGALVSRVVAAEARVDILVNAAGVFRVAPMLEMKLSEWETVLKVNLTGIFIMTQAAGAVMLRQGKGRVINLGSVSSRVGNPEYAAYAASKGGVAQLTKALGAEWCRHGVLVNALGPAFTETPLTRGYLERPDARQRVLEKIPMGRMGEPRDIVGAAVFLASDASEFVVGQTLYVDGGRTL